MLLGATAAAILAVGFVAVRGALPEWIRNAEARTAIEAAFFRSMPLPGGDVSFRRPPAETRVALGALIKAQPKDAELYSLLAREDEQQLDFASAEANWKRYVANSPEPLQAQLSLADFYRRRLRPLDEIAALSVAARTPADASEKLLARQEERSWRAFQRIFSVITEQGLPATVSESQYQAWIARYPGDVSLYANYLQFLIAQKNYASANELVTEYRAQFPNDRIFPIKAQALLEYRQGSLQQGLAVYEKNFQPLWDPELVKGYFDLLNQTHNLRESLDDARAAEGANPTDLTAAARLFYYYQYENKLDAAADAITSFGSRKDTAKSTWSSAELLVCARLLEDIRAYPEAARFYFALYNSQGANDARQRALEGLANLLFTASDAPIQLGSGNLSMYRDVATLDSGPGYLNGILSLILNTTDPAGEYAREEQKSAPYFRKSQAAQLLALLDTNFPDSSRRPELHAKLLDFYAASGESEAVIRSGTEFLADFPNAPERTDVSLLMADAYARTSKSQQEFAIYDSALQELAARADRVPLGSRAFGVQGINQENEAQRANAGLPAAFQVNATLEDRRVGARSPEYQRVLDRYLARLAQLKDVPAALVVLRREIDRNPDDPGLYQQLAQFLQQNRLDADEEEIYRRAIARFPDRSWYQRLARFYLRARRNDDFEKLTQKAVNVFKGTELEEYFRNIPIGGPGGPALYLRVNQYANARFPHNPVFVRNLLNAYRNPQTANAAAWETLIRQHWFEEADLRDQFFEYLTRTGKLDAEIQLLQKTAPGAANTTWDGYAQGNPAAAEYLAEANLWRSHFEEGAPALDALAAEYPADVELGNTSSAVNRSLAYFDQKKTDVAAREVNHLSTANPRDTEVLARIGDLYADRSLFTQASPYWERIPQVAPGESGGYLDAATIYWDYFDYDNALRLLGEGRQKLGNENLYRYESGAIYEGKRDYARAIQEYVQGALDAGGQSPAEERLLVLARRPQWRSTVSTETGAAARAPNAPPTAVALYARVLETQNRKQEAETFLNSLADRATTLEQASDIDSLGQQYSLDSVRLHALEKESALAFDPVARLQLRYELVMLEEGRGDFAAARKDVEALYRDNPRILGVVRATVDFYWQAKMYPQAIAVLLQAGKDATPGLAKQFRFEAARKSTERKLYGEARNLLNDLLTDSPYNSEYLAALADTYAAAGDQQGLKQLYMDELARLRSAPLPDEERKTRIAEVRRVLIPALDLLKDPAGAVDQYVELINNFPEDEGLTNEAAQYAVRSGRQTQLVDYYNKTVSQSPRDFRWPMVLARIETNLENFPAAIGAYGKASAVRPDRTDFRIAAAELDERLMRLDDAADEYGRVYQLAYKDPQWMEKVAEIRARQGRTAEAVAALQTALIVGFPEKPQNYFEVARRLTSWGMLTQARQFAEQGLQTAGGDLLADAANHQGAELYTEIMTRLHQQDAAYGRLQDALKAASSPVPVIEEQLARGGLSSVTDTTLRNRLLVERVSNARKGMQSSLVVMGTMVATYFTPEEKVAFAQWAQAMRGPMSLQDVDAFAVPLAQNAGLAELEAAWRFELMIQPGQQPFTVSGRIQAYAALERRRTKFAELGTQLEQAAGRFGPAQAAAARLDAAEAYNTIGDESRELRVLNLISSNFMDSAARERYLGLLLAREPQQLVQFASQWTPWGEQAADFAVVHADAALAKSVIAARGRTRTPIWSKAYSALAGLYFSDTSADVNADFLGALGDGTIGDRLNAPVNRDDRLSGDVWFYYGSRYGEYLDTTKQGNPDDFLVAELEHSPASPSGYVGLADYHAETGDTRAAIADYEHGLELEPNRADLHERLAVAYEKQGSRNEAIAEWKTTFGILSKSAIGGSEQENFWGDFSRACDDLRARGLFAQLRTNIDEVLRGYLRKYGNYRSNVLLQSAYLGEGGGPTATAWLLDLAAVAPDPTAVVADVAEASWIPLPQRALIYQRILDAKEAAVLKTEGLQHQRAEEDLVRWQMRWAAYLVDAKRFAEASRFLASLSEETRNTQAGEEIPLELRAAAKLGTLDEKIARFRSAPKNAPSADILRNAAQELTQAGDNQSARKILEFMFAREISQFRLDATNFLGLAEARIDSGDLPGGVELLRRLALIVGAPYDNLDSAAGLLERTGNNAEAIEFLDEMVKSAPWNSSYALRLAKAKAAASSDVNNARTAMANVAGNTDSPYRVRENAALALAGGGGSGNLGGAELGLLAGDAREITAVAADQPFFSDARLKAAQSLTDADAKIRLLSNTLAESPDRTDIRIALFQAAGMEQNDQLAVAAISPLLVSVPRTPRRAFGTVGISPNERAPENPNVSAPEGVAVSEWPAIAALVGECMTRLDRLSEAIPYLQTALDRAQDTTAQKKLGDEIAVAQGRLSLEEKNVTRAPILHQMLEQQGLVRPKLTALPAAPAAVAGKERQ